jgi:uncharacterized protein YjbJ (UPF0337 family)
VKHNIFPVQKLSHNPALGDFRRRPSGRRGGAGLALVATLSKQLGTYTLANELIDLGAVPGLATHGRKVLTLVDTLRNILRSSPSRRRRKVHWAPFMVWPSVAHSLLLHLLLPLAHARESPDLSRCGRPVRVINLEEQSMGTKDRASNRAQDPKGRVTKAVGRITGNRDLKNKTTTEQVKAGMKTAGENLEDAGYKVKDAAT